MGKPRRNPANIDRCEPICVECGERGRLVSGAQACPDKPGRARELFYLCDCGAWVSCHVGTGLSMGRPGNATTRYWRIMAHKALDGRWMREGASRRGTSPSRRRAYAWLAGQLGISVDDCHIGRFDAAMCRRAVAACGGVDKAA